MTSDSIYGMVAASLGGPGQAACVCGGVLAVPEHLQKKETGKHFWVHQNPKKGPHDSEGQRSRFEYAPI